jgi:hypothetical protein
MMQSEKDGDVYKPDLLVLVWVHGLVVHGSVK